MQKKRWEGNEAKNGDRRRKTGVWNWKKGTGNKEQGVGRSDYGIGKKKSKIQHPTFNIF